MIPVGQRIVGGLSDPIPGDCLKCCVASVLERRYEEVPHFVEQELTAKKGFHLALLNEWLRVEGYPLEVIYRRSVAREDEPCLMWLDGRHGSWWPHNPGWWMAAVKSKRFTDPLAYHVVVMHEDRVTFDPSDLAGTLEYDERPYVYDGWHYLFIAPEPWRARLVDRPPAGGM